MSFLAQYSAAFTRNLLAPQATESIVFLLTITQASGPFSSTPLRVCNQSLQRLDETPESIVYGCVSDSREFIYFPFGPALPGDEADSDAQFTLTLPGPQDATLPFISALQDAPDVLIEVALSAQPDVIEARWPGMKMGSVRFGRNSVSFDMSYANFNVEPFPKDAFTPQHFKAVF